MREKFTDKADKFAGRLGATLKSAVRLMVKARPSELPRRQKRGRLFVLGNGPSLSDAIAQSADMLRKSDTLAVNFAANTPEFFKIRPKYYVLADPHFFRHADNENVARLIRNLNSTDWLLTLFIPHGCSAHMFSSPKLDIRHYNMLAVEGFAWFENMAYGRGWGMPRPRNVLIPSIMIGLQLGYEEIVLLGADHSWLATLSVDDDNRVVSIQKHYYEDEEKELERIRRDYVGLPLHEVVESMAIAFRAYHRLRAYAERGGQKVVNATPGSMIDAFNRRPLRSFE